MKEQNLNTECFNLGGNVALVTGAGTGLGRQFALTLARAGARVILAARRKEKLDETAAVIRKEGGEAFCFNLDVTSVESVTSVIGEIRQQVGIVDILVNNAGANVPVKALEVDESDWDKVLDTNLKGAFLVAREVAGQLAESGSEGSIINIASILGLRVQPEVAAYSASKAGLIHLTRSLALEWARYGIRVNTLAPGYLSTDLTEEFLNAPAGQALIKRIPQRRAGNLDELTWPLLLLASKAGSYITGSTLTVDGGLLSGSV